MKEMICIVCPKGCRLKVDENNNYNVTGNACPRGAEYGKNETRNPVRVLTTTVKIGGAKYRRCPVRTEHAVPKGSLMEIMQQLNSVCLISPVAIGDIALENAADTGINVIVTKDM
ncbi:MAG: DUF1667 domain-containing protein [Clostridia bacterium]|nr:DUF1667 domain-containing protein [Clostridia bacterium]